MSHAIPTPAPTAAAHPVTDPTGRVWFATAILAGRLPRWVLAALMVVIAHQYPNPHAAPLLIWVVVAAGLWPVRRYAFQRASWHVPYALGSAALPGRWRVGLAALSMATDVAFTVALLQVGTLDPGVRAGLAGLVVVAAVWVCVQSSLNAVVDRRYGISGAGPVVLVVWAGQAVSVALAARSWDAYGNRSGGSISVAYFTATILATLIMVTVVIRFTRDGNRIFTRDGNRIVLNSSRQTSTLAVLLGRHDPHETMPGPATGYAVARARREGGLTRAERVARARQAQQGTVWGVERPPLWKAVRVPLMASAAGWAIATAVVWFVGLGQPGTSQANAGTYIVFLVVFGVSSAAIQYVVVRRRSR